MAGGFSVGGLITGLDTNNLIQQLLQIERQPIVRIEERIKTLESQKEAIQSLRTTLTDLRNQIQDFRLNTVFSNFNFVSSNESVLTASGGSTTPAEGSFVIDVLQVASASTATSGSFVGQRINSGFSLATSGIHTDVTSGAFSINGVAISVNANGDSITDVINAINASGAGVLATYDSVTDTVTLENSAPGDTSLINLGQSSDTSNFLSAVNLVNAPQTTGSSGSTTVTSSRNLGAIDPGETIDAIRLNGTVSAGTFFINGIAITVDPTTDSVLDVISRINDSDAGVRAAFDTNSDTIRIVSETLGSRTIGFSAGTSNFLEVFNLDGATPAIQTAGKDAEFTIDGGPTLTRNTNTISDAINGVTLNLSSAGATSVTVSKDNESVVSAVQAFIEQFNTAVKETADLTKTEGDLRGDGTIRSIETFLRTNVFGLVSGLSGPFSSLIDIGITTGDSFDASAPFALELDEDAFLAALADEETNVQELFTNDGETGIGDVLFNFLDEITKSSGSLNARARANGSIDQQIETARDRIQRLEDRLVVRERRLRAQFAQLEQLSANFQQQNTALLGLQSGLGGLG